MRILISFILYSSVLLGTAYAQTQSDWSEGDTVLGPVTDWQAGFDSSSGVSWRTSPGQLALSSTGLLPGPKTLLDDNQTGAFGIEAADLDGDGDLDLIGAAESSRDLTIWFNNGDSPTTFTEYLLDGEYEGVSAVYAADIDGDLDLDIVACTGKKFGRTTVYYNEGGSPLTWTSQNVESFWGEAWEISAADVNNDGHMDIVGTFLSQNRVIWWHNDGSDPINWTRYDVDSTTGGAHNVRAADVNGDGHTDLVSCGSTNNQIALWTNNGDEPITWTKQVLSAVFFGGRSVRLGDIDDDGDIDVAAAGFNGRVNWWSNGGGDPIVWTQQVVDSALSNNHQLQMADVTGDGLLDLVAASYGSNAIAWWENGGGSTPITWTKHFVDYQLPRPLAVEVGDVNGNGALEIIASSNTGNEFYIYDPTAFVAGGSLISSVFDLGAPAALQFDWTAITPPGTSVHFQVRGSDDPGDLGAWSTDISTPQTLDPNLGRYIQYQVFLSTSDDSVSPIVEEVMFTQSVSAVPDLVPGLHMSTFPNPANPRVVVAFELPQAGKVRIDVFDVRGHRINTLADQTFVAGPNEVVWQGTDRQGRAMATGTYQVRLSTQIGSRMSRVTLVR